MAGELRSSTLIASGFTDMQRAFAIAERSLSKETKVALRDVAEPVRHDAELLAVTRIRKIGLPWSRMRIGVTKSAVYVAPKQRRGKGSSRRRARPNLAGLLMDRSMLPSLNQNTGETERRFGRMLDAVGRDWEDA